MRINQVDIVSSFKLDSEVVLTRAEPIRAVATQFKGSPRTLNIPDGASPELPRMLVKFSDALLGVSEDRFTLRLSPPSHVSENYADAMGFVCDRWMPMLKVLADADTYEWSGLVTAIEIPCDFGTTKTAIAAVAPIFTRLTTLEWDSDNLSAFQIQVGRRCGDFHRNYTIGGYEERQIQVTAPPGLSRVRIKSDEGVVVGVGYSVNLDVNNMSSPQSSDPVEGAQHVFREHEAAFNSLDSDLNLEGLI